MERVASVKLISTTPESATNRQINREWRSAPPQPESVSVVSCVSDSREAKSQSGPGVVSQRVLCAWCAPPLVTHGTRRGMGSRECRTRACGATILCCIEKGNGKRRLAPGRAPASWVPVLVQLPTAPQSLRRVIVHWDVNAEMQSRAHGRQSHLQREPGACLHSTRCRLVRLSHLRQTLFKKYEVARGGAYGREALVYTIWRRERRAKTSLGACLSLESA